MVSRGNRSGYTMAETKTTCLIQPRPSPKMEQIYAALTEGWPDSKINLPNADMHVIWGLLPGNTDFMVDPWVFCDMPYHGRYDGNFEKSYWRWCVNSLHDNRRLDVPSDRFEAWNIDVKPWKDGEYILICPSSNTMTMFMCGMDAESWAAKMYEEVKKYSTRPVKVRFKPRKNNTSGPAAADVSIEEDLYDAHAVITSASLTAIDALKLGVPVFTDQPRYNPAAWCANTDFTKLNKPEYYDREHLFYNLAYKQYSIPEMRDGTCYENSKLYLFS